MILNGCWFSYALFTSETVVFVVFGSLSNHKRWLITLPFNTIYYIYDNLMVAIVFNMDANDIYIYI